ncbi:MAG: CotH kinase family protein [Myxococcota bacterium]
MPGQRGETTRAGRAGPLGLVALALGCSEPFLGTGRAPEVAPSPAGEEVVGDAERPEVPEVLDWVEPNPPDEPDPGELGDYEALFDASTLQEVHLTVPDEGIDALNADGGTYVRATFEHEGAALEVGLRLKGSSTYQDFDGKPAFRVKFNEFVDGQRYAGVKRLALNNLTGDPAQGREVVSYWVWASGGMFVPRATLARVYVNDDYYGLYALLESMDEEFLERRFADPTGDLWAANDEADLTADRLQNFTLQAGMGYGPVSLAQAAEALAAWDGDFYAVTSRVLATDQYLDYVAYSIATGGDDGYPWHLNDFFVYADPGDGGRLKFSPWGQDESWNETWAFEHGGALLGWRCELDPDCVARLGEHVEAALEVYERLDVAGTAEALFALSAEAAAEDTRSPYAGWEVEAARALLVERMRAWPATVRAAMGI